MGALLNLAMSELSRAEERLEDIGLKEMMGYCMSRCLAMDDVAWAEEAAAALTDWANAKRQLQEAKRIATWNPETGWRRSA